MSRLVAVQLAPSRSPAAECETSSLSVQREALYKLHSSRIAPCGHNLSLEHSLELPNRAPQGLLDHSSS